MTNLKDLLLKRYSADIVDALIKSYQEIESNYALRKWKASELDAGHFVEAVRRIIEFELFGSFTPLSNKIENFSDGVMKRYEQAPGDESFRLLIPRILKSVYNIRNKRGVGHISTVSPNEMDSTYILYSVKWVIAEIVRLTSNLSIEETQKLIDDIVEREVELLWSYEGTTRVLDHKVDARSQVLILLYAMSPQSVSSLQMQIEYKNTTNFRKILNRLHDKRYIEYIPNDAACIITTKGIREAEDIIKKLKGV